MLLSELRRLRPPTSRLLYYCNYLLTLFQCYRRIMWRQLDEPLCHVIQNNNALNYGNETVEDRYASLE